jgi:chitodextrinase/dihydrofolate reductase
VTSTNPLQIGGDSLFRQYFNGIIDEVRVYNVALTAAQIQTDMNAAIGGSGDTQPPTVPSNLTATVASSSQINLSWTASTDNVGVTGYLVERCQGAGCTSFAQIATSTGTIYNDTGRAPNTAYSYRVRAMDAAGNLSPYSNVASATTQASTPGLVAAYGFNEGTGTTVADASGHGNTGTITNATWTTGKYGKGLSFNGSNTLVTINDSASLHLTAAMTLEAWVNMGIVDNQWEDIVYKGNDNYYLEATSSKNVPAGGGTFGTAGAAAYGTSALPQNAWTHVAVTYDGATLRLYVNGVQVSSLARTGNLVTSTNPLQIGGDSFYRQYFNGIIDEVRVYNVALTAAQIQTDIGNPLP